MGNDKKRHSDADKRHLSEGKMPGLIKRISRSIGYGGVYSSRTSHSNSLRIVFALLSCPRTLIGHPDPPLNSPLAKGGHRGVDSGLQPAGMTTKNVQPVMRLLIMRYHSKKIIPVVKKVLN